jgi:hypothetical protein
MINPAIFIPVIVVISLVSSAFGRDVSFTIHAGHLRHLADGHANATWSSASTTSTTTTAIGQFQRGSIGELRLPTLRFAQFDFGSVVPEPLQTVRSLAVELSVRQRDTITGFVLIDRVQFTSASRTLPLALVMRNTTRAHFASLSSSPLTMHISELDCWFEIEVSFVVTTATVLVEVDALLLTVVYNSTQLTPPASPFSLAPLFRRMTHLRV